MIKNYTAAWEILQFFFHVLFLFKNLPLETNKVLYSTQDLKTDFQKGHCVTWDEIQTENSNIYNNNDVITQTQKWINKLFSLK